jgi:hypothetical protein
MTNLTMGFYPEAKHFMPVRSLSTGFGVHCRSLL